MPYNETLTKGKIMNKYQKIGIALMALSVIAPAMIEKISYEYHMRKPEKTLKLNPEVQAQINALFTAKKIVEEKIMNGDYEGKTMSDVDRDFKFYTMMSRFSD